MHCVCCVCVCQVTQSCPTLCSPTKCSPPGSSVHGIFQARILEWGAISCFRGLSWSSGQTWVSCIGRWILYHCTTWEAPNASQVLIMSVCSGASHVWLFVTPWTVTCQAPLSMEFFRQEFWSRFPFPSAYNSYSINMELCLPEWNSACI